MRNRRISCRIVIFTLTGLAILSLRCGLQAQPAQDLHTGASIERRMEGGETHSYGIVARPGTRLLVTVDQKGIDITEEVLRPDGSTLIAVDGPWDRDGLESVLLPPDALGPFEVRVRSSKIGVAPGFYAVRLEELAVATPTERERVEAERLMTEAAAANKEGSAESLRLGAARYQEALVRWRAPGNRRQEARCLVATGEIHMVLGQPKPALESFQQALALFAEPADEAGQAVAWSGIGLAHTALGDPAAALAAQRRALDLERGLGRLHQEAKALNNIGLAFHSQGDLREALGFFEQALEAFHRAGEKGTWEAAVLQNLAVLNANLGEPEAALQSHLRDLELQRALKNQNGEAQTLNNLGVLHDSLGQLGKALEVYASALAIFRRSGDRLWEAVLLRNRGSAFYRLGDYQQTIADLEQALAIYREAGDRRGEVGAEISLGYAHLRLGDITRALDFGRRAASVASTASDRRGEMRARRLLSEASLASGVPAAALPELARALDLARALESRFDEALILRVRGEAHLSLSQPDQAVPILEEAVGLSRAIKNPVRIMEALIPLARAHRLLGRPADARSQVEEALRLIEALRTTETDPDLRASFLASQHAAFELEIDLLMELERRQPGQGHARAALEVSERARARSLLDLLQEANADIREGVDPQLRDRERALLVRLNAKASRLAELQRRPAGDKRLQAAAAELQDVIEELARTEADIRRQSPRYAALTRPPLATSEEIQSLLDGDTLLLEFALGEKRSFLWAVDHESVTGFELPARARIEEAARQVYGRLSILAPEDGQGEQLAASLSRMLLSPVAEKLAGRRLIIVADGELQYIPFGMLPVPETNAAQPPTDRGSTFLLARHEVVTAPSASAIALQRRLARRNGASGTVAVLADPVFDPEDPRVSRRIEKISSAAPAVSAARSASDTRALLRLPWTRREAEVITATVPAGRSLVALDFRASRETALSPELTGYRIVHFATHGIIDSATPALSGLMLSRVGEHGEPREGFLGLRDIYNLRLGADLVVLSACETALGKEVRGEGLVGLTQGFLYAGAKQVVATLWRVEDRSTAELMSRFYHGLLIEGHSPAAALRRAQLAIQQDKRWRSPYYWSGFVLQGDWSWTLHPSG
jgi:CHAT domain-containing protein/tetratricopeptide (TPR) repeat protein